MLPMLLGLALLAMVAVQGLDSASKQVDEAKLQKAVAEVGRIELAINNYNVAQTSATTKITADTSWDDIKTKLRNSGYLDVAPEFENQYGCTYGTYSTTYTESTKKTPHVKLSGCSFAKGYKPASGPVGTIQLYAEGTGA